VLFLGAAIVLGARAVALPRLNAVKRLREIASYGFAGEGLPADIAQDDPGRPLERLARQVGAPVVGRLAEHKADELRRQLRAAGLYTAPIEVFMGYRVLFAGGLLGFMALLLATSSLAVPIKLLVAVYAVALSWYLPLVLLRRRGRLRLEQLDRQLPDLIELLVVTLEAGLGFSSSLRMATARVSGALGDELRLAVQEQDLGTDVRESLQNMLQRADSPAMRSFVRSIDQGQSMGVSVGTIMRNLASEMRKRRRASIEERAQKAPVKMLFPLVFLILPALFLVLGYPVIRSLAQTFGGA
jgi:tight adherence protein C